MKYLFMTNSGPHQQDEAPTEQDAVALEEGYCYDIFRFSPGNGFERAEVQAVDDARSLEWVAVDQKEVPDEV